MNLVANQSAQDTNDYSNTVYIQNEGKSGYDQLKNQYENQRTLSMQLYMSTAIFGAITATLFGLDFTYKPEGPQEVYLRGPGLILDHKP